MAGCVSGGTQGTGPPLSRSPRALKTTELKKQRQNGRLRSQCHQCWKKPNMHKQALMASVPSVGTVPGRGAQDQPEAAGRLGPGSVPWLQPPQNPARAAPRCPLQIPPLPRAPVCTHPYPARPASAGFMFLPRKSRLFFVSCLHCLFGVINKVQAVNSMRFTAVLRCRECCGQRGPSSVAAVIPFSGPMSTGEARDLFRLELKGRLGNLKINTERRKKEKRGSRGPVSPSFPRAKTRFPCLRLVLPKEQKLSFPSHSWPLLQGKPANPLS